jgi:hypothetical protein
MTHPESRQIGTSDLPRLSSIELRASCLQNPIATSASRNDSNSPNINKTCRSNRNKTEGSLGRYHRNHVILPGTHLQTEFTLTNLISIT